MSKKLIKCCFLQHSCYIKNGHFVKLLGIAKTKLSCYSIDSNQFSSIEEKQYISLIFYKKEE